MEKGQPQQQHHDADDAAYDAPPNYSEATTSATVPTSPPVHHFVRHNRLSSKVLVRCDGVDRYCFASDSSKVSMYAGVSTSNTALGCLTFPKAFNTFRMEFGAKAIDDASSSEPNTFHTDVVAGIGFPHPKTFSFKVSEGVSSRNKELVWTHKGGDVEKSPPVRYDLNVKDWENTHLATLTVAKKGKDGTTLSWKVEPENELQQAFAVLSAIGIITRLSRKGKYYEERNGLQRYNIFMPYNT